MTRVPLFFPEKRDFFLADAGLFELALPSGFGGGGSQPIPFFSGRIGLDSAGKDVPILAGGNLAGRAGDLNIGTLETVIDRTAVDEEKALGVLRLSYNVAPEASAGRIATAGRPEDSGGAYTGGVDFKYGDSEAFGPGHAFNLWGWSAQGASLATRPSSSDRYRSESRWAPRRRRSRRPRSR